MESELIHIKMAKGKGRGVFAKRAIKKGTIIERVPIILMPASMIVGGLKNPELHRYFFEWNRTHVAITLGYGSIYNHSFRPNAGYVHGPRSITFRALRNIARGEEITTNYNHDPQDRTPMPFKVV